MSIEVYETMSTATMWLLLFVVAALALLIAALTKTKFTVQKISIIGIMAALSFVAYEFFRIPNVFGTGSSFHLGNTFTALTAMLLDGVSGGLAGAIGLALADVVAGDPGYAITTFILKFIIGLVCGAVSHKVIHLRTFPTGNKLKYVAAVTASAFSGLLVNVFTDPFIGYFRNLYIFGQPAEFVSVVAKIASGVTLVNSLLSTVCAVVLYIALRPALEKAHLAAHLRRDSRACIQSGNGMNRRTLAGNIGKTAAERIVLRQRRRIAERGDASDGIAHQGRIDVLRRGQHAVNAAVDRYQRNIAVSHGEKRVFAR